MKLTPPALFSATKSDFTESATSFKLLKVREGPDFISGFTLCAFTSSFSGILVVAEVLQLLFLHRYVHIISDIFPRAFKVSGIKATARVRQLLACDDTPRRCCSCCTYVVAAGAWSNRGWWRQV